MSVRRQIISALSGGRRGGFVSLYDVDHATRLVDAHAAEARAEALVEGAAAIDAKQNEYEAEERRQFGSLDHETVLQGEAVRSMAALLRQMVGGEKATPTGATATPFFQPGRVYSEPSDTTDWRFRCDTVTAHPGTGERTALGWRHFHGEWEPYAYHEDDFEIHQIADAIGSQGDHP